MIRAIYRDRRDEIEKRLDEFKKKKTDKEVFSELAFCLLTPQSKARICWKAVSSLIEKNILWNGDEEKVRNELKGVRFKNKKARFICEARGRTPLIFNRDWLAENIKGMGYKEASHFLRNIGLGEDLAILDRHILKNLKQLRVINEIPSSLTKRRYFEIEKKMKRFADRVKIPMGCLDMVLWCKETGEVFK